MQDTCAFKTCVHGCKLLIAIRCNLQKRRNVVAESQQQREMSIRLAWEDKEDRDRARAAAEAQALEHQAAQARQARAEAEVARQREIQQRMYGNAPQLLPCLMRKVHG